MDQNYPRMMQQGYLDNMNMVIKHNGSIKLKPYSQTQRNTDHDLP